MAADASTEARHPVATIENMTAWRMTAPGVRDLRTASAAERVDRHEGIVEREPLARSKTRLRGERTRGVQCRRQRRSVRLLDGWKPFRAVCERRKASSTCSRSAGREA